MKRGDIRTVLLGNRTVSVFGRKGQLSCCSLKSNKNSVSFLIVCGEAFHYSGKGASEVIFKRKIVSLVSLYLSWDQRWLQCQHLVCFSFLSADLTLSSRGFWWLVHFFSRKLKKLFRKLKDETEPGETDSAHSKHSEQWERDYSLEPYTGLTPEYMEMSKSLRSFLPVQVQTWGLGEPWGEGREMTGAATAPLWASWLPQVIFSATYKLRSVKQKEPWDENQGQLLSPSRY